MTTDKGLKVSVTFTISKCYNTMLSSLFYFLGGMFSSAFKNCASFSVSDTSLVLSLVSCSTRFFVSANSFASSRASSDKYSGAEEDRFTDSAEWLDIFKQLLSLKKMETYN